MAAGDVNFAELDYAGLRRVYIENIQMRSIEECENLLAAIRVLRLDRPTESDKSGERIALETLKSTEEDAKRKLGVLRLTCQQPVSYLPPDDLH